MAQQREVVRFGPIASFIANGVRTGNVIHLSGQVSMDAGGQVVGPGDLVAQVRQTYANIIEVLEKFDASLADVVDETWFVTDMVRTMAEAREVFTARTEAYGRDPDVTQTLVQVSGLVMPELLLEIKCIAHV